MIRTVLPYPTENNGDVIGMVARILQTALSNELGVPVYSEGGDFKFPMVVVRVVGTDYEFVGQHTQKRMGITFEIVYTDEVKAKGKPNETGMENHIYTVLNKMNRLIYDLFSKYRLFYKYVYTGSETPVKFDVLYLPTEGKKKIMITGKVSIKVDNVLVYENVNIDALPRHGGGGTKAMVHLPYEIYLEDEEGNREWDINQGVIAKFPALNNMNVLEVYD